MPWRVLFTNEGEPHTSFDDLKQTSGVFYLFNLVLFAKQAVRPRLGPPGGLQQSRGPLPRAQPDPFRVQLAGLQHHSRSTCDLDPGVPPGKR